MKFFSLVAQEGRKMSLVFFVAMVHHVWEKSPLIRIKTGLGGPGPHALPSTVLTAFQKFPYSAEATSRLNLNSPELVYSC